MDGERKLIMVPKRSMKMEEQRVRALHTGEPRRLVDHRSNRRTLFVSVIAIDYTWQSMYLARKAGIMITNGKRTVHGTATPR